MAKKQKPTRPRKPPTNPKTSTSRTNGSGHTAGPRSQALPGLEKTRIVALDNACEALAEIRASMAGLRADEGAQQNIALKAMRKHNRTSWNHVGVELTRVPGEEKLRIRTTKGGAATAEVEPDHAEDEGADLEDGTPE